MPQITESIIDNRLIQEKYHFKKKLGKGGFCDVFQAVEIASGRPVAVKMMQTLTDSNENEASRRAARFKREMRLYGELNHPNIVSVLESGETETGLLYIVFEYIEGQTLANLLRKQGALPVARAMAIMMQVLEGLTSAHEKGIIHRDLKPANIMLLQSEATEKVKLLDFGISTFLPGTWKDHTRLTITREFLGTPSYASPEQLRGEPVNAKTDIYSWGLLFLECLTGKPPFENDSVASIVQHQLSAAPVPIPLPLMDHSLGVLLRWVLDKDFSRRSGNSGHVLERLKNIAPDSIPQKNGFLLDTAFLHERRAEKAVAHETAISMHERRQVTVLCFAINIDTVCDQASLEVLDEIYNDLFQLCTAKLKEFGGHVAGDLGDRLMVYFGFPHASDSDARRAVRAALELSALLTRRSVVFANQHGFHLSHQIGLHTGMVTVRSRALDKEIVFGITPNLAAKLCSVADENAILISEDCYNLLKDGIEGEMISADKIMRGLPLKNVYRVIGERSIEGLIGLAEAKMTPMIGRDFEHSLIIKTWDEIQHEKKGKIFCLQGDAGLGKTRLAAECAVTIQRIKKGAWMECRCTPEHKNTPLFPVLDFIKTHLGLLDSAGREKEVLQVLEEKIKEMGMVPEEIMPLLCPWLGIPLGSYVLPPYSPQKIKEMLLKTAASLVVKIAQAANAVIMMEDLHWIDPTTLEILPLLIERIKKEGLLMLMSTRPEFAPTWDPADVEIIPLTALDGKEIEKLIVDTLRGQTIAKEVLRAMVERADGVPLFGEELARMFLEKRKEKDTKQAYEKEYTTVDIPNSLRDLLAGRLDRLGPAKETAQLAAALGRTFDYNVLARVSLREEASLLADLDQLVSAGLLHLRLRVGNPEYMFHHALVRDSAYDGLASKAKIEIHQRIAQTLESEFADVVKNQPETVARHWAGAGDFEKAVAYGTRAAGSALSRALNEEAITHGHDVLEWIPKIPTEKRNKSELAINGILTQALMFKYGWAYPQVRTMAEKSRGLLKKIGKNEFTFPTLWALATYHHVASNRKELRELTDEMDAFASESQDAGLRVAADTFLGLRHQTDGDFPKAAHYLENAIAKYDPSNHANHSQLFGFDTRVWASATLALVRYISGYEKSAQEARENAIAWARELNHIPSIAITLMYRALAFQAMGDKNGVLEAAGELVGISEKYGLPAYSAYGAIILSWATSNIAQADAITDVLWNMGCKLCVPLYKSLAADNEAENGNFNAAIQRIDHCIKLCEEIDEPHYVPILHFRKGVFCRILNPSDRESVVKSFGLAAQLARQNGMTRIEWYALIEMQKTADSSEHRDRLSKIRMERPELLSVSVRN